jgi:DNA invertase Pin-like site-specific DNA recombinase
MKTPTGDKLAAYIRVSSDKQDTQRQTESVTRWAAGVGLPILNTFADSEGKNPRDQADKRPEFQKLLRAVERGEVDTIIVDSQDRFGTKNAHEFGKFMSLLGDHGCELWSVGQGLLSGVDDATILTATIGALTSSREQREKSSRNLSGKISKARAGEYQGGYPPYGFDVVCFNGDREQWRVVWVGHFERWKVYPNGEREAFNGKGNFPAKNPTDSLRYRPSLETERIETARSIFNRYATEDISPYQIATQLNQAGIRPGIGKLWDKIIIRQMLKHPVYIGFPCWNKRGGSRFNEYVGGQMRIVPDRAKLGRHRDVSDYIQPEAPEFDPLITPDVWDKVQAKLTATVGSRKRRPAQTAELWLRPFLFCGHCGKLMRANSPAAKGKVGLPYPSYTCGTYGTYGKRNPAGCRCHRVKAEVLEQLVEQYIDETAPGVRELLNATDTADMTVFNAALRRLIEKFNDHNQLEDRMESVGEDYGTAFLQGRPELQRQIRERETELDKLIEDYRGLPPKVRERVNQKMETLQDEIDGLRAQLVDLREPWARLCEETKDRAEAFDSAYRAMDTGASYRQKAEALRGVVDRVVCYFRYTNRDGSPSVKSTLDRVEIIPLEGSPARLPVGITSGQG